MEKRTLGSTGIEVSALCIGTDLYGSKRTHETCATLLDFFRSKGGTFVDTANFYASWLEGFVGGESETTIGNWMRDRGCRNEMVVASKLAFDYPGSPGGLSAGEIERECEGSLRRLRTDHLDLYYSHRDDRETPLEETMEAFNRLVTSGKVRAIGASNLTVWRIAQANMLSQLKGWAGYSAVEQRYTYVRPRYGADFGPQIFISEDLKDYARSTGITLVAYSILLSGAYLRDAAQLPAQFAGPDSDARVAALREVAAETGASVNQVLIAWMRQSDPPILPIIAGSSVAQLDENIRALHLRLEDAQ
ncbi:MAG TPA: aldo/keto reductase, partial [Bryobacteraceae bacterium]|nr:aldo/keto reductase [Bryobacteraceae bacterium]